MEDEILGTKSIVPKDTDAFELADFETPLSTSAVPNVMWSIEKHKVAQMLALSGLSKTQISRECKVPLGAIKKWQESSEFRDYVNQLVLESANLMKAQRLQILTKILNARIDEAEKTDDYARLSKADTVDIIAALRKETAEDEEKKESKYVQILEKMVELTHQPKVVSLPNQQN